MSYPLGLLAVARREYDDAVDYMNARRRGRGDQFAAAVDKVLDQLRLTPERYPLVEGDVREAPVPRTRYCLYYRVVGGRVTVISVFHTSRAPAVWLGRAY